MRKLTPKQKFFCKEYIVDLNGTQACIRAGYSERSAKETASRLLTKDNVQAEIQRLMDKRSARLEITQDMVLRELAKLGFSNMQNLYDGEGNAIPVHKLPVDVAATLQEVTQDSIGGEESIVIKRKYKTSDKKSSLELIGRHLKMFTDKVESSGPGGNPIEHKWLVEIVSPDKEE